jgi:hypothetical protein
MNDSRRTTCSKRAITNGLIVSNKAGSLRTICILVMFDVLFIVIFKLRSYILSFHTMYFY